MFPMWFDSHVPVNAISKALGRSMFAQGRWWIIDRVHCERDMRELWKVEVNLSPFTPYIDVAEYEDPKEIMRIWTHDEVEDEALFVGAFSPWPG